MADDDPYASIATPIAPAAAPARQPLRNPRIAGNEPDPYASIATPIAAPAAATPPAPKEDEGFIDRALNTEIPLTSYGNATLSGLQSIGRGVRDAVTGVGTAIAHPIKSAQAIGDAINAAPAAISQVPGAIKDINASADPLGTYAKVAQETAGEGAGQALTSIGAEKLPGPKASASEIIPKAPVIAGTELPETVGQAASRANPAGIGTDIKGVEDVARKIPGSEKLRNVSTAQQAGAREIIANKLSQATGAETSTAPEAIEQNARNAVEAARQTGNAKYKAIATAAQDADLTKPVEAAHDILQDEATMKVLPKSARDALGKLASSMSEREEIAHQIYGKGFTDLEPVKQAEVTKAMGSNPTKVAGIQAALDARSELGTAANAARDNADARLLHLAHEQMGQAITDTLQAHNASLVPELAEADKTWSQKYAFEKFLDKVQGMNRDQPQGAELYAGHREMSGADFQKIVNDLDPLGAKGKTDLQRMFPDDPQSVKDFHELADFMGHNQGDIGNLASGMAKKQLLGLQSRALMLIANNVGFSWLLSKPGMARAILTVLKGGRDVTRMSAAIGQINHAANQLQQDKPETTTTVPPGRVAVSTPKGIYHFPNQQAADAFKFSAGIQ